MGLRQKKQVEERRRRWEKLRAVFVYRGADRVGIAPGGHDECAVVRERVAQRVDAADVIEQEKTDGSVRRPAGLEFLEE